MKNKGVIIFLVLTLIVSTPMVSADNFLSGYSIFDKVSNFFESIIEKFQEEIIGGPRGDNYYILTLNIIGEGYVSISPEYERYREGTEVTLETFDNAGYIFTKWEGDYDGNERDITITMDRDKTITAHFVRIYYGEEINEGYDNNGDANVELCIGNERRCGIENECNGNPCVIVCQNNQWIEFSYCANQCENGECIEAQPYCGNGVKEGREQCDGDSWGEISSCEDLGYDGGILRCVEADEARGDLVPCRFDISSCYYEDEVEVPTPTNVRYRITDNNHIILTWDNVLKGDTGTPTADAITGYAIYEKSFLNKIINFINKLFGKEIIATGLSKEYIIYKKIDEVVEIGRLDYRDCSDICMFEYNDPREGDKYGISSKIGTQEGIPSNLVGPIHLLYTLTINIMPSMEEWGSVTKSPDSERYRYGQQVTLTAIPIEDFYDFSRWADDGSGINPTITITIDRDKTVTAHFRRITIPPNCGNGEIDQGEECDGDDFGGLTCEDIGRFSGGELLCNNDCTFDTLECEPIFRRTDACNTPGQTQTDSCIIEELHGICKEGGKTRACLENLMWGSWSECIQTIQPRTEICNDENNLDEDCDGLSNEEDPDCIESNCNDNIDNDRDGLIDDLDPNCEDNNNGLKITNLQISKKELYVYEKLPTIQCFYEMIEQNPNPLISPQNIMVCVNLTLNNKDITCQQKAAQQGAIRYSNCDIENEEENKIIKCSAIEKCNAHPSSLQPIKHINVTEFTTCEYGQILPESLMIDIREPDNNEEFKAGDKVNIEVKVTNNYEDEEELEVTIIASLIDITEWEEIESTELIKKVIDLLDGETFELNLTIPIDLEERDYRLYVKAFKFRDEDELCKSNSVKIRIQEQEDEGGACEENIDCPRGFVCTDNDCTRLSCNPPLIISLDGHSCILPEDEREGEDGFERRGEVDLDGDGLPDYWEYNHFGNLDQGPYDDPDGDRIPNIDEFTYNTNPNVPDKKKFPLLTILLIILGIVIMVGVIFFVIKKIKNKPRKIITSSYSLDQTNKDKLQTFIQQAKAQGMSKQQIKNSLLNAGWNEQDINKFL